MEATVIPPPLIMMSPICTTLLRTKHSSARDAALDAMTKEKKLLPWDKGVHNRPNCRIVISKPC